jgi:hypothetical protein
MAVRLFLVEASGEVIPCLCAFKLWHDDVGGGGSCESLWFRDDTETRREFYGSCGCTPRESRFLPPHQLSCLKLQTTHDVTVTRCWSVTCGFQRTNKRRHRLYCISLSFNNVDLTQT